MNRTAVIACVVLLSILGVVGLQAQSAPPAVAKAPDPDRIGRSLERIADSLEVLARQQKTVSLIQRAELEEQRLAPLREELDQARGEVRRNEQVAAQMDRIREDLETRLGEAQRAGNEEDLRSLRDEKRQLERAVEVQKPSSESAQNRVRELELELDKARRALRGLEERIRDAIDKSLE